MQVKNIHAVKSTLVKKEVDLSLHSHAPRGESAPLAQEALMSADDLGVAIYQSTGVSDKDIEIAVALDLARTSDTVKEWVLSRMAETQNFDGHVKVIRSLVSCTSDLN